MPEKVAIVYNEPVPGKYHSLGEGDAVDGVLDAVKTVSKALNELQYDILTLALKPPLSLAEAELVKLNADMVFNLFEGFDGLLGSEATIANFLENMGLCFTGSGSSSLHSCENKATAKRIMRSCGIPSPNWQVLTPDTLPSFNLGFPSIVKPVAENASHGITEKSVVEDIQALSRQVDFIFRAYGQFSLVEEFLPGREFSALVMGNDSPKVFPISEIMYNLPDDKPRILTYSAKWSRNDDYFNGTKVKCPADVNPELKQQIERLAIKSFIAFECRGYARIDMRQDKRGRVMVLETNPNPDISSEGGARLQMEAASIDYVTFIDEILSLAKKSYNKNGH
jgi:D-alanine-D-alanine ligase